MQGRRATHSCFPYFSSFSFHSRRQSHRLSQSTPLVKSIYCSKKLFSEEYMPTVFRKLGESEKFCKTVVIRGSYIFEDLVIDREVMKKAVQASLHRLPMLRASIKDGINGPYFKETTKEFTNIDYVELESKDDWRLQMEKPNKVFDGKDEGFLWSISFLYCPKQPEQTVVLLEISHGIADNFACHQLLNTLMSYYCTFSKGVVYNPEGEEFKPLNFPPTFEGALFATGIPDNYYQDSKKSAKQFLQDFPSFKPRAPFHKIGKNTSHEGQFLYYKEGSQEHLEKTIKFLKTKNTNLSSLVFASCAVALCSMTEDPINQKQLSFLNTFSLRGAYPTEFHLGAFGEAYSNLSFKVDQENCLLDVAAAMNKGLEERKKRHTYSTDVFLQLELTATESDSSPHSFIYDLSLSNFGKYPFSLEFETVDKKVKLLNYFSTSSSYGDQIAPYYMYFSTVSGWAINIWGLKDEKNKEIMRELVDRAYMILLNTQEYSDKTVKEIYKLLEKRSCNSIS